MVKGNARMEIRTLRYFLAVAREENIKKTATPDKRLTRVFGVIDKGPHQLGTGAILCMADHFSAFDRNNLIVPIWMI